VKKAKGTYDDPIDADFQVVDEPGSLPAERRREPLFKPRTEPIIKSWESLAGVAFVILCIVVGRLLIWPLVGRLIHPLLAR
jgi:hypothetical protein